MKEDVKRLPGAAKHVRSEPHNLLHHKDLEGGHTQEAKLKDTIHTGEDTRTPYTQMERETTGETESPARRS